MENSRLKNHEINTKLTTPLKVVEKEIKLFNEYLLNVRHVHNNNNEIKDLIYRIMRGTY